MSTILLHMVWPLCEFRMQVWNVLRAARWKYRTQEIAKKSPSGHHPTTLSSYIFATKACIDNQKKNLLSNNISSISPHNMMNFGPLVAEIVLLVWGTPANFNGFHVLAALLRSTLVVGVSQTLRCWTEGATYIQQGGHHVGHCPTFLVYSYSVCMIRNRYCPYIFIGPFISISTIDRSIIGSSCYCWYILHTIELVRRVWIRNECEFAAVYIHVFVALHSTLC